MVMPFNFMIEANGLLASFTGPSACHLAVIDPDKGAVRSRASKQHSIVIKCKLFQRISQIFVKSFVALQKVSYVLLREFIVALCVWTFDDEFALVYLIR